MTEQKIAFGDRWLTVDLPESAETVSPGALWGAGPSLPPVRNLAEAVRNALRRPEDGPPLSQRVKRGAKVTVAFDDPTVPCYAPLWKTALSALLEELELGGVDRSTVTLLCANALHRQFTPKELASILGKQLVEEFDGRLACHDAEDRENLAYLGRTPNGYDVELNRRVVDSDLLIYLNANSARGFGGGWKSVCVGLSTWRSIRYHHTPDIMTMSLVRSRLHEILDEMGALVEAKVGPDRIFKVETVLSNPLQAARVWAGSVGATRGAAMEVLKSHHVARRDLLAEKKDIVLYGVPDWSPYAVFSHMNPILTLLSTGLGYLGGVIEALGLPGCSVILATPCPDRWDEVHHPSYREVWERVLTDTRDPYVAMERYEADFTTRPGYIEKYRHGFGFHPVHGLLALQPLKRLRHAGKVFVAGIEEPRLAHHLGFEPTSTVEEAVARARAIHGREASIACVQYPAAFNRK